MKRSEKGQGTIEYTVIVGALVALIAVLVSKGGMITQKLNETYDQTARGLPEIVGRAELAYDSGRAAFGGTSVSGGGTPSGGVPAGGAPSGGGTPSGGGSGGGEPSSGGETPSEPVEPEPEPITSTDPVCGDGACNGTETCTTCVIDCASFDYCDPDNLCQSAVDTNCGGVNCSYLCEGGACLGGTCVDCETVSRSSSCESYNAPNCTWVGTTTEGSCVANDCNPTCLPNPDCETLCGNSCGVTVTNNCGCECICECSAGEVCLSSGVCM